MIIQTLMKMAKSSPHGVENTVEKGEIVCQGQFLLFPQCFQKSCTDRHVKTRVCLGKG